MQWWEKLVLRQKGSLLLTFETRSWSKWDKLLHPMKMISFWLVNNFWWDQNLIFYETSKCNIIFHNKFYSDKLVTTHYQNWLITNVKKNISCFESPECSGTVSSLCLIWIKSFKREVTTTVAGAWVWGLKSNSWFQSINFYEQYMLNYCIFNLIKKD